MVSDGKDGSLPNHRDVNGSHPESKLELFGFDSLVNILGLKRYGVKDQIFIYIIVWMKDLSNHLTQYTCIILVRDYF